MKKAIIDLQVFLLLLLSVAAQSCKEDEPEPIPLPQSTTVTIAGTSYETVKIGTQTWTASNYAGPGGVPYNAANEKPEYGRYYTFVEAQAVQLPAGWRIPTQADYIKLAESQGVVISNARATKQEAIKKLVSKTNWRTIPGDNASGFNAFPAGYMYMNAGPSEGDICEFWVADGLTLSIQESASGTSHNLLFYSGSSDPGYRFNLRFVKDN